MISLTLRIFAHFQQTYLFIFFSENEPTSNKKLENSAELHAGQWFQSEVVFDEKNDPSKKVQLPDNKCALLLGKSLCG